MMKKHKSINITLASYCACFVSSALSFPAAVHGEPSWLNNGRSNAQYATTDSAPQNVRTAATFTNRSIAAKDKQVEQQSGTNKSKQAEDSKAGTPGPQSKRDLFVENLAQMRALNEKKDYAALEKLLRPMAESGDRNAQYELSNLYFNGRGLPRDMSNSAAWAEKSANGGHPGAQYMMGGFSLLGQGVPRDSERAMRWFRLAADQGHKEAQFSLAMCYLRADAAPEDQETGMRWLQKAAASGSTGAQIALAQRLFRSDPAQAFKWMSTAAKTGDSVALLMMGDYYHSAIGITKDDTKAFEYWKKSADQGNAEGERSVGQAFREGLGVTPDLNESFKWAKKAADKGSTSAMYDLGQHYLRGIGTAENIEEAFKCFSRAAAAGNFRAQNSLGAMYLEGRGVKQDPEQALKWFQRSASQGYEIAKENAEMVQQQLSHGNKTKFSVKRPSLPHLKDGF